MNEQANEEDIKRIRMSIAFLRHYQSSNPALTSKAICPYCELSTPAIDTEIVNYIKKYARMVGEVTAKAAVNEKIIISQPRARRFLHGIIPILPANLSMAYSNRTLECLQEHYPKAYEEYIRSTDRLLEVVDPWVIKVKGQKTSVRNSRVIDLETGESFNLKKDGWEIE